MIIKSNKNVYKNYFGEDGISKIYAGYDLVFGHEGEIDYSKQVFGIKAILDSTIEWTPGDTIIDLGFKYSFDKKTWTDWDLSPINLHEGEKIYLIGNNENHTFYYYTSQIQKRYGKFKMSVGQVELSGNVNSLIDYSFLENRNSVYADDCFYLLFLNCLAIIDASKLYLPSENIKQYCYYLMFAGCNKLYETPKLNATTLATRCYARMFEYCRYLNTAPELPAVNLASGCYEYMFYYCDNLMMAPLILPATTLTTRCYYYMFANCEKLLRAPELPATTLVSDCYSGMFSLCYYLDNIKAMFITIPKTNNVGSWVSGVSSTGTFVVNSQITWDPYDYIGVNGIPEGWLIVDENGNEYQKPENQYAMPYLFKVSYNDGNQDVTVTKNDTTDKNNMITNDEWVNAAYRGTYTNTLNQTISLIWIGDECEYIGDYNDPSNYNDNTTSDILVLFIKGTTSKKLACKKIVVGPNVKKIVGNLVMMHALASSGPRCFVFLGDRPELPYGLKLSGDFLVTGSGTEEDPYTTQSYVYVKDELVNDYYTDSSFLTNNYGYVIEPSQDYQVTAKEKRRVIIKPLSEYDSSTFGDLIDPVPVLGE